MILVRFDGWRVSRVRVLACVSAYLTALSSLRKENFPLMLITVIKDCGWQIIAGTVLIIQFLMIGMLRARIRQLQDYEYWFFNQPYEQPRVDPQAQTLREPLRPLPRRRR